VLPEEKKEKEFIEKLGKRIKALRLSKELRQNEVAYRCNFDKSSYNNIEAGERNITITTLLKISNALQIDIIEFFSKDEEDSE